MSDATMYAHKNPGVRLDGGPAFPFAYPAATDAAVYGMNLRDYFAAAALRPLLQHHVQEHWPSNYARWAYELADAMLKERAK